jgi:hypothetical protein
MAFPDAMPGKHGHPRVPAVRRTAHLGAVASASRTQPPVQFGAEERASRGCVIALPATRQWPQVAASDAEFREMLRRTVTVIALMVRSGPRKLHEVDVS